MITLTDTAAVKVKELLDAEGNPELALRVAVRPGGCSGFSYEMFFDGDVAADDEQAEFGGVRVRGRPVVGAAAHRRHARLQGRPAAGRVQHQQPERHPHLRLRPELQLTDPSLSAGRLQPASAVSAAFSSLGVVDAVEPVRDRAVGLRRGRARFERQVVGLHRRRHVPEVGALCGRRAAAQRVFGVDVDLGVQEVDARERVALGERAGRGPARRRRSGSTPACR